MSQPASKHREHSRKSVELSHHQEGRRRVSVCPRERSGNDVGTSNNKGERGGRRAAAGRTVSVSQKNSVIPGSFSQPIDALMRGNR
ncbi:hypothetical protein R1flu_004501 [Riccia fluitans]|uniref:Uncharacterized protein n=1 Tax=Riccia fluitans TaxID=41844 RepID=A0ABD1YUH3_9MARC